MNNFSACIVLVHVVDESQRMEWLRKPPRRLCRTGIHTFHRLIVGDVMPNLIKALDTLISAHAHPPVQIQVRHCRSFYIFSLDGGFIVWWGEYRCGGLIDDLVDDLRWLLPWENERSRMNVAVHKRLLVSIHILSFTNHFWSNGRTHSQPTRSAIRSAKEHNTSSTFIFDTMAGQGTSGRGHTGGAGAGRGGGGSAKEPRPQQCMRCSAPHWGSHRCRDRCDGSWRRAKKVQAEPPWKRAKAVKEAEESAAQRLQPLESQTAETDQLQVELEELIQAAADRPRLVEVMSLFHSLMSSGRRRSKKSSSKSTRKLAKYSSASQKSSSASQRSSARCKCLDSMLPWQSSSVQTLKFQAVMSWKHRFRKKEFQGQCLWLRTTGFKTSRRYDVVHSWSCSSSASVHWRALLQNNWQLPRRAIKWTGPKERMQLAAATQARARAGLWGQRSGWDGS